MRHLPHGTKKWILHCVDHWSKFNFAYALEAKNARNVADVLNRVKLLEGTINNN